MLYIPTYGRSKPEQQYTFWQLHKAGLVTTLVVQARERGLYGWVPKPHDVMVLPTSITTIAPTREYIYQHTLRRSRQYFSDVRFIMMDDDLYFYRRDPKDRTKFIDISSAMLSLMVSEMYDMLIKYAMVGIAAREGGNRNTDDIIENTRIMRVLGFHSTKLRNSNVNFADVELMEDFHAELSLLKNGYPTCVLNEYCHNQAKGSAAPGGCTHQRTPEKHEQAAIRLSELHAPFVKLAKKTTKTAWGGGERTDVRIHWKKAYEHGKSQQGHHSAGVLDKRAPRNTAT